MWRNGKWENKSFEGRNCVVGPGVKGARAGRKEEKEGERGEKKDAKRRGN
jgi:hypothetical protein